MVSALMKKKASYGGVSASIDDQKSRKHSADSTSSLDDGGSKKRMKREEIAESNGPATRPHKKASKRLCERDGMKEYSRFKDESDAEVVALLMDVKTSGKPPAVSDSDKTDPPPAAVAKMVYTDDGNNSGRSSPAIPYGSGFESGFMSFPEKIMMLLNKELAPDAMWWIPDGDAFCIMPVPFTEKVLDKHFQGTKFESFTRKLNRWGFKRVAGDGIPSNAIAFYHNLFHKNKPELLKDMSGGKARSPVENRDKKASSKEKESIVKAEIPLPAFGAANNTVRNMMSSPGGSANPPFREQPLRASVTSLHEDRRSNSVADILGSGMLGEMQQSPANPSPQLQALLAQQMGIENRSLLAVSNEARLREQLFRRRNMNQVPVDILGSLTSPRIPEVEHTLPSSDVMRLLSQQGESMYPTNLSSESTRLLLQQLGSSNSLGTSDLASRLITQRANALGQFGGITESSSLLEQLQANQLNPDADMTLRLLMAQQRQQVDPLSHDIATALVRQQMARGDPINDMQTRLMAERLRAAEGREPSSDLFNRLLAQQVGSGQHAQLEAADIRARLMRSVAPNNNPVRIPSSQSPISDQQGLNAQILQEFYLMEQQRDIRSRLAGGGYGR